MHPRVARAFSPTPTPTSHLSPFCLFASQPHPHLKQTHARCALSCREKAACYRTCLLLCRQGLKSMCVLSTCYLRMDRRMHRQTKEGRKEILECSKGGSDGAKHRQECGGLEPGQWSGLLRPLRTVTSSELEKVAGWCFGVLFSSCVYCNIYAEENILNPSAPSVPVEDSTFLYTSFPLSRPKRRGGIA